MADAWKGWGKDPDERPRMQTVKKADVPVSVREENKERSLATCQEETGQTKDQLMKGDCFFNLPQCQLSRSNYMWQT